MLEGSEPCAFQLMISRFPSFGSDDTSERLFEG